MPSKTETFRDELSRRLSGYEWSISQNTGHAKGILRNDLPRKGDERKSMIEVNPRWVSPEGQEKFHAELYGAGMFPDFLAGGEGETLEECIKSLHERISAKATEYFAASKILQEARMPR